MTPGAHFSWRVPACRPRPRRMLPGRRRPLLRPLVPLLFWASSCAAPRAAGPALQQQAAAAPAAVLDPVCHDPSPALRPYPWMRQVAIPSGEVEMVGVFYGAAGPGPHPTVILVHGFPGNDKSADLAHALRRAGYNALIFHYRGTWGSPGAFSLTHAVEDVTAAVRFCRERAPQLRIDPRRLALVGPSTGGFAALLAASQDPSLDTVASLAGFNFGRQGMRLAAEPARAAAFARDLQDGMAPARGATGEGLVAEMIQQASRFDLTGLAPALASRSLLLVSGTRDEVSVPAIHHRPLMEALRAAGARRLTEQELPGDHGFSGQRIALTRAVLCWLRALPW